MLLLFCFKRFAYLALTFILFTIIGTISHEYGHILVAEYYGYKTTLHYGSMHYDQPASETYDSLMAIAYRNGVAIRNGSSFAEKDRYDSLQNFYFENIYINKPKYHRIQILVGGPLQTFITSIVGIFILTFRRMNIIQSGLTLVDWIGVFLALFSLRFVANAFLSIIKEFCQPNGYYFGGDEARLAKALGWYEGAIAVPMAIIGLIIAAWVIFTIVPKQYRLTFILSGLIGGVIGYLIWLKWLGPIILP